MFRIIATGILLVCIQWNVTSQSKLFTNLNLDEFAALFNSEKDNITIVNFWASWCGPCMEELPYFKKLKSDMPNARVILVNLDFEKEANKKLLPILGKGQYESCEIYRINNLAVDDWMPLVDINWSGAIPATVLLAGGKKKIIEQKFENYNALKNLILQF